MSQIGAQCFLLLIVGVILSISVTLADVDNPQCAVKGNEQASASVYRYAKRPAYDNGFDAASVNYHVDYFRGELVNPTMRIPELENLVDNFETFDGDMFICTYPKSGTTWAQYIVNLILNKGEAPDKTIYEVIPWLEAIVADPILHLREAHNITLEKLVERPRPRYFKSHATWPNLPRGRAEVKTLVIARNPKDVCVSLWYHAREKPEFNFHGLKSEDNPSWQEVAPHFEDFVRLFLAGKVESGSWFDHVLEWYAASLVDSNVQFLKYEDLVKDQKTNIAHIADFMEIECDVKSEICGAEMVERVANRSTMAAMHGDVYGGNVRSGGIGKWRKMITGEINDLFDKVYREKMDGTGLLFDFGDGVVL